MHSPVLVVMSLRCDVALTRCYALRSILRRQACITNEVNHARRVHLVLTGTHRFDHLKKTHEGSFLGGANVLTALINQIK